MLKYGLSEEGVFSSPVLANGVLYTEIVFAPPYDGMDGIYALDAASYAVLWQYPVRFGFTADSPAVVNGAVYANADGSIFAFGLQNQ
jgi:outer membrane protein assembly factor BamB